jgi:hypothetical protein
MSTIPKEIMGKIDEAGMKMFPDWANAQSGHGDLYERFVQAAVYGYQLATDGREELEKENDELKVVSNSLHGLMLNGEQRGYDKAAEEFYNQIESLKAENEGHKEIARARGEAINELQAENERLKWMMEQLSNGEAMNVVRESEGVYSVIFKTPKENS